MINRQYFYDFVKESNYIEKIFREPSEEEINELQRFVELEEITVEEVKKFVSIYQPDAKLRNKIGMDVRVGNYYPKRGHPDVEKDLKYILSYEGFSPHHLHLKYEELHPFMDCNGRSGRALWLWKMKKDNEVHWKQKDVEGGFLLNYYFQTLQEYTSKD